jgi:phenylpropionate dioxygenase-like ring-hydroxylating dioxygenase large terminal subunit
MLTHEENDTLTKVGPDSPMGQLMRRYWVPALLSDELEADGAPVRVKLLGEKLVAFRATNGRVGLLSEFCAHRSSSLWLGRNEENGLRCVFHGWKYDVQGQCVDMMNEPEEFDFKAKIKAVSYPVLELAGLVWAYMGPRDRQPPPPKFDWTQAPADQRHVNKTWQECNWLQGLEGGLDTSHAPIMHRQIAASTDLPGVKQGMTFLKGKAPKLEVDETDYGYAYYGIRELEEGTQHVRGYHFVMPFTQVRQDPFTTGDVVAGHMWVPMDDDNCMVYNWEYSPTGVGMEDQALVAKILGTGPGEMMPNARKVRNKDNDYLIDREAQKSETFTGIFGINTQDHAVQESMGPIADRSIEHLGPADRAIIVMRKILLQGVKVAQDGGDPAGTGTSYYNVIAADTVLPAAANYRQELRSRMYSKASTTL